MRVTIQQAAANAFAAYLAAKLPDIAVESRWPSADKQRPPQSITVIPAGRRRDLPIDVQLLKKTNRGSNQVDAVWQVAACTQPFQLDVWSTTDVGRDDILARLDDLLHADQSSLTSSFCPTPAGTGALIAIQDGWQETGSTADFVFDAAELATTADAVGRSTYRATFRGEANFMLTVTSTTARQVSINFQLRISETDIPSDFP